jgi:uncharacterized protein YcgL (UPF0745 family)
MTEPADKLPCWIYKSPRKNEMYLYLAREDGFDELPEALLSRFGKPEFVMELELHADRPLAREDVSKVMANLRERGFHLQMPPELDPDMYYGNDL